MRTEKYNKLFTADSPEAVYALANPVIDENIPVDERFQLDPRVQGLASAEVYAVMETIDSEDGFWTPIIAPQIDEATLGNRSIVRFAFPPNTTRQEANDSLSQIVVKHMDDFPNFCISSASVSKVNMEVSDAGNFTTCSGRSYHIDPILEFEGSDKFSETFKNEDDAFAFAKECSRWNVDVRMEITESVVFHVPGTERFEAILFAHRITDETKPVENKWWFIKRQVFLD